MITIRKKTAYAFVNCLFSLIACIVLYFIGLKKFSIICALISIIFSLNLYGIKLYDLGLILMPFMFYLNIGGAVNTSLADFIIAFWSLSVLHKLINNDKESCSIEILKTKKYIIKYSFIFICIMTISLVNFIRWDNATLFQPILSIVKIIICFLYALFTLDYIGKYGRDRFLRILAYCTVFFDLLMISGVFLYTVGIDIGLTFAGTFRATGTFEDPNLAAAYLFIMYSFSAVYFTESKKKVMFALATFLTFISVLLTSSKGAMVAMLFGLVFLLIVNLVKNNYSMFFKLLIGYCLLFVVLVYLYNKIPFVREICEPIFTRLGEFTSNVSGDHSLAHREYLWKTAFDLGMTSPVIGIGVELFRPAASQYTGENVWNIVHNTYLTFFCELGILGFFSFFRLWIKNIWNHFRLLKVNKASVFYLFSMLCVSVSMWSISLGNFRMLWIFMTFLLYEYNRTVQLV